MVDLLIVELRADSKTVCDLIDAMRPIFDCSQQFYTQHFQKEMKYTTPVSQSTSTGGSSEGAKYVAPTVNVSEMEAHEIDWRNGL